MNMIRYIIRVLLWKLRSIWRTYPKPHYTIRKYTRGYLRLCWKPFLRNIDASINDAFIHKQTERFNRLLIERRLMVMKRRRFILPLDGE